MTELEAEALAARLTQIWIPDGSFGEGATWKLRDGKAGFAVEIASGLLFERVDDSASFPRSFGLTLSLTRFEGELKPGLIYRTGHLYCFSDVGDVCIAHSKSRRDYAGLELFQQFAWEWTPFFRRGCWLSGCPIEASAHEKAEWMQGFTEKEIESWDLKF